MVELTESRHNEEFLLSEANGTQSRGTGTLAASSRIYESGDVVINTGAGGSYVLATKTLIDANANADVSIVARKTYAVGAAKKAALIVEKAEVKSGLLGFGAGTTEADVAAALAKKSIKVRASAEA